jgi:hypothetical protein
MGAKSFAPINLTQYHFSAQSGDYDSAQMGNRDLFIVIENGVPTRYVRQR